MIGWRLALRALGRDWRAGELRILAASLLVAVTAATSVGFFTDRVYRAMQSQAAELLAADLVVITRVPPREELLAQARSRGIATARTVDFPSVVLAGDVTQLVQVKAVERGYPLRGELRLRAGEAGAVTVADVPPAGEVWVEPRVRIRLGLRVGDPINLGDRSFVLGAVLDYEPDRGGELFRLAPRVMLNYGDLDSTGLVNVNSRVRYRLLLAGTDAAIADYRVWVEQHLETGERVQDVRNARPELRVALDRARQHLSLAALVSVLVAGAAIALAARHYAERQADAGAVMRCLGARQGLVLRIYAFRLLNVGLIASVAGCAFGYLAQSGLARVLEGLFVQDLPAPGWTPAILGAVTGLIALTGFALPPLLRLREVPPLRVLRRELGAAPPAAWLTLLLAAGSLTALLMLYASDPVEAAKVLGGVAVMVMVFWLLARLLIRGIARLPHRFGLAWRYGINRLERSPGNSVLQIVCYGLGITALLVLTITRVDLLASWRATLPEDAPNHFLVNVQHDETAPLVSLLERHGFEPPVFFPVVHGRLVAINEHEVNADSYSGQRAKRLISREFHLSWSDVMPDDNRVVAGRWWGNDSQGVRAYSVETGIAETLGIEFGDVLHYQVAGERLSAEVTSLREVDWDSFNVNFFVIASPDLLGDYPAHFITSVYLPPEGQSELLTAMAREFPSVTVLDVRALMQQVRTIMDRAATAIEYVFLFTLLAGVLVMYAAIQSSQGERRRETALLRALGASRRQILAGLVSEFVTLGVAAGVLAAAAASIAAYLLSVHVFDMPYSTNPALWAWALFGGGAGIGIAGIAGAWRFLNQPPMSVLRYS